MSCQFLKRDLAILFLGEHQIGRQIFLSRVVKLHAVSEHLLGKQRRRECFGDRADLLDGFAVG
jgi:hypothetical protein